MAHPLAEGARLMELRLLKIATRGFSVLMKTNSFCFHNLVHPAIPSFPRAAARSNFLSKSSKTIKNLQNKVRRILN